MSAVWSLSKVKETSASDGATICGAEGVMKAIYLAVGLCLLPAVALAAERSEPRWMFQRSDGEWFKCKGEVCDQPVPPPAWAPLPERQTPTYAAPLPSRPAH
jgi:hypothetical protein